MLWKLAFRNVGRNLRRLRPMLIALVVAFAILLFGNALLEQTDQAFSRAYVNYVSGDVTISEPSPDSFTLFGSEALLVGEYIVPPTLADSEFVARELDAASEVRDHTFVVTGAARLEVGERRENHFLFGVNFEDYARFLPDLQLIAGSWPEGSRTGIVLQVESYQALFDSDDYEAHLGEMVVLTAALSDSFVIRDAPLLGVYEYPVQDALLSQVALVDADTVRSLNGYVAGGAQSAAPSGQEGLLTGSLDDLFGAPAAAEEAEASTESGSVLDELDLLGTSSEAEPVVITQSNAWNFALVRSVKGTSAAALARRLQTVFAEEQPYLVRDWRRSIGGNVMIVYVVRLAANIGMFFVIFGAVITTVNAIVLSVLDRTKEIGTMRAVGATKAVVGRLLTLETVLSVFGAALLGIVLGSVATLAINVAGVSVVNQYLRILFGGGSLQGLITGELLLLHAGGGFLVALLAVLYPLRKALRLSPLEALNA